MQTPLPSRPAPRSAAPHSPLTRTQQTRLQRQVVEAGARLEGWARNPWRRLALQLIVLLTGFVVGGGVGAVCGALALIDHLAALLCVVALELAIRSRRWLLRRPGDRLGLELLDMARLGVLYGLLLDGFKLL
ncbi:MAG: DUF565 domain-containing protein [Synechococcus sp.]